MQKRIFLFLFLLAGICMVNRPAFAAQLQDESYDWGYDWDYGWDYDDGYDWDYGENPGDGQGTDFVANPVLDKTSISLNLHKGYLMDWGEGAGYYSCDGNEIVMQGVSWQNNIQVQALDEYGIPTTELYLYADWGYFDNSYYVSVYPQKTGKYMVEIVVDGNPFRCEVVVYDLFFKKNSKTVADGKAEEWIENVSMLALYRGESTTLKAVGAQGKVTWASSDTSVAKVSSKGKVTAKNPGYAVISATCGEDVITYMVGVAEKTAVLALRNCYKMYKTLEYSQEKRMLDGYADCSSFVWKGYKAAGKTLGNDSYALTAAGLSDWCMSKGYRLFYWVANTEALLPGDLVFWCGRDNGRSDGIYHVDIYQGNGVLLTVETERWIYGQMEDIIVARPCKSKLTGVAAESIGDKKLRVSWKKQYGVTGYNIYQSTSENGTYEKVGKVKASADAVWESGELEKGKTYYYKVRAYWKAGGKTYRSNYSTAAKAKVKK